MREAVGYWLLTMGGALLALAFGIVVHPHQPQCGSCGVRGKVRWLHQRRDGKPDRRARHNARICGACGAEWTPAEKG